MGRVDVEEIESILSGGDDQSEGTPGTSDGRVDGDVMEQFLIEQDRDRRERVERELIETLRTRPRDQPAPEGLVEREARSVASQFLAGLSDIFIGPEVAVRFGVEAATGEELSPLEPKPPIQAIIDASRAIAPQEPGVIGSAIGSSLSFLLPGRLIGRGARFLGGTTGSAAVVAGSQGVARAGRAVEVAEAQGEDFGQLAEGARLAAGAALGGVEVLPFSRVLRPLARVRGVEAFSGRVARKIGGSAAARNLDDVINSVPGGRLTTDALLTGTFEAAQETVSELAEAELDSLLLNYQRDPELRDAILGGGASGFLISAFFGAASGRQLRVRQLPEETKRQIARDVMEQQHDASQAELDADSEPVEAAEAPSSARVRKVAEDATPEDRIEAIEQIDRTLQEDAEQESDDDRMTGEQRRVLEGVRQDIADVDRDQPAAERTESEVETEPPAAAETAAEAQPDAQREFGPRARETSQTKALLEQMGLRLTERATVDVGKATRQRFADQEVAARIADRQARRQERAVADQRIAELRNLNRRREANRRQLRQELMRQIRSRLPKQQQADLAARVEKVRGRQAFDSLLNRVEELERQNDAQQARDGLRKTLNVAQKRLEQLDPSNRQKVEAVIQNLRARRPGSKEKRRTSQIRAGIESGRRQKPLSPREEEELAEAAKTPIDDLDVGDVVETDERLTQILHQAALKDRIVRNRRVRERRRAAGAMRAELESKYAVRQEVDPTQDELRQDVGLLAATAGTVEQMKMRDLGHFIGPTFQRYTYADPVSGYRNEMRVKKTERDWYENELGTAIAQRLNTDADSALIRMDEMSSGIMDRAGPLRAALGRALPTSARTDTFDLGEGRQVTLTEAQQVYTLWMLKDPEVRQDVLSGGRRIVPVGRSTANAFTLNDQQLDRMVEQMRSDVVARNADGTAVTRHDLLDTIADQLFRRVNSSHLQQMVRDTMLELEGRDRTRPGVYAPRRARKLGRFEEEAQPLNSNNFVRQSATQAGMWKSRSEQAGAPLEIVDAFEMFDHYVHTASALTQLGPAVVNARKVFNSPEVQEFLNSAQMGRRINTRVQEYLDVLALEASNAPPRANFMGRLISGLTRNVQQAVMAFSGNIGAYQQLSVPMAVLADPRNAPQTAPQGAETISMSNLMAVWMTRDVQGFFSRLDAEIAQDPELFDRMRNAPGLLLSEGLRAGGGPLGRGKKPFSEVQLALIRLMDRRAIRAIWAAADRQGRQLGLEGEALQQYTAETAARTVRETQPTSAPTELSAIGVSRRLDPATAPFAAFRSYTSQLLSTLYRDVAPVASKYRRVAGKKRRGEQVEAVDFPTHAELLRAGRTTAMVALNTAAVTLVSKAWFAGLATVGKVAAGESLSDAAADAFFGDDEKERRKTAAEDIQQFAQRLIGLWPTAGPVVSSLAGNLIQTLTAADRPAFEPTDVLTRQFTDFADEAARVADDVQHQQFDNPLMYTQIADFIATAGALAGIGGLAPVRDIETIVRSVLEQARQDEPAANQGGSETDPTRRLIE